MRLLPRSAKGVWLLAGIAWAMLSAGIWFAFPPLPRAKVQLEPKHQILGVSPSGQTVTVYGPPADGRNGYGPFSIWNTLDGSLRPAVRDPIDVATCSQSIDGRWLVLGLGRVDGTGDTRCLRMIDLRTGEYDEWTGPPQTVKLFDWPQFSSDGRWLAFRERDPDQSGDWRLWDLQARSPGPLYRNVRQLLFSPDSQLTAIAETQTAGVYPRDIVVQKTANGGPFARIKCGDSNEAIGFTSDNGGLIVRKNSDRRGPGAWGFLCLDVATGRTRWEIEGVRAYMSAPGRPQLAVWIEGPAGADRQFVILDKRDGRPVTRIVESSRESVRGASFTGEMLTFVASRTSNVDRIRAWLADLGVPWLGKAPSDHYEVRNAATNEVLLTTANAAGPDPVYSPDESSVAVLESDGWLSLWDLPPTKPVMYIALSVIILALPLAWLARRRVRRLRWEAA
jgi:hypothetical protein